MINYLLDKRRKEMLAERQLTKWLEIITMSMMWKNLEFLTLCIVWSGSSLINCMSQLDFIWLLYHNSVFFRLLYHDE